MFDSVINFWISKNQLCSSVTLPLTAIPSEYFLFFPPAARSYVTTKDDDNVDL